MVQRAGSFRRKTRSKLKKNIRDRGKISIRKYLQTFKEGEIVVLKAEPAVQRGMYFPRYHGKSGRIKGKKGNCYEVLIKDGGKEKTLIVHPIHLKK
ncbi:50S ribosomal protein L21e [Candidatus Woesearchaeota archaeon]|nr:50S ribosomal protein L21e [Candidatus Woesearchaeota archaeon]